MTADPQASPPRQRACRYCGAVLWEDKPYCWLCHQAVDGSGLMPEPATVPPAMPPVPPPLPPEHFTYSLSTLMLAMTLVAVLSGLCAIAPGLGIPLAILAVPAWIRAARVMRLKQSRPDANSPMGTKIEAFMASLGFALLVCLAAGAAGFAACTGIVLVGAAGSQGYDALAIAFPIGIVVGSILALYIFVMLSMKFWPRRKK